MYKRQVRDTITAGSFCYRDATLEFFKNGNLIPLSAKETVMMKLFISNLGRVFTKEQLYELVWGEKMCIRDRPTEDAG